MTAAGQETGTEFSDINEYGDLLRLIEPRLVTSEEQADQYLEIIDNLTDLRVMSAAQIDMVGLLGYLVSEWEEKHEAPITFTPEERVRYLLEENGLPQAALVPKVFPNRQNVSAFLAGRRPLTYDRAVKLGAFFNLPPTAFYMPKPAPSDDSAPVSDPAGV